MTLPFYYKSLQQKVTKMKTVIFSVIVYPGFFAMTYWAGMILTR